VFTHGGGWGRGKKFVASSHLFFCKRKAPSKVETELLLGALLHTGRVMGRLITSALSVLVLGRGGAVGLGAVGLGGRGRGLGRLHLDAGEARDACLVESDAQAARVFQCGDVLLGDRVARVDRGTAGGLAVVPDVNVLVGASEAPVDDASKFLGDLRGFTSGLEAHHERAHTGVLAFLELDPDAGQDVALSLQVTDDLVEGHAVVGGTFFALAEQRGAVVTHLVAGTVGATTEALAVIGAELLVARCLLGLELLPGLAVDVHTSCDESLVPGPVRADVQQNGNGGDLGCGGWIAHGKLLL
jgi:hypothetical protein